MPDILVELRPGVYFYMRDDGMIGLSVDTKKEPTTDGCMYLKFSYTTLCRVVKEVGIRYLERAYKREMGWKEVMVCVQDIVCALLGPDYYIDKKIPEDECCRMEHDIEDDRDLGLVDIVVWGLREAKKAVEGEDEYLDQPEDERFFMASKRITDALDAAQNLLGEKEIDPYSLFAPHECGYDKCKARAKYMVPDGFGRTLLVCEQHYTT